MPALTFRNVVVIGLLIALVLLPVYAQVADDRFMLTASSSWRWRRSVST